MKTATSLQRDLLLSLLTLADILRYFIY